MFADLMNRLLGETPPENPQADYRTALAALLVRCAKVDGVYDPSEQAMVTQILIERYGLSADEAARLKSEGEALEIDAGDTVHLTRLIKDGVPYEERIAVVEALWRIVLADETRDAEENAFLRLVVSLIGVNDRDSGLARQRVSAQLG